MKSCPLNLPGHAGAYRRLHVVPEAPQDGGNLLQSIAEQHTSNLAQLGHEVESAALALAVLVRLTSHAGVLQ